jgi:BrnA antitoxin of type II toxin-antitoxin system
MRLDADILDWFRGNRGYQTRINAILRAYMNATPPAPKANRSGKGHSHHSDK